MSYDARTRMTKKMIRESFSSLLAEKSVHEITVKDICERAEINRSTFYRYYDNPWNLLQSLEKEFQDYFMEKGHTASTSKEALKAALEAIRDKSDTFLMLISDNADPHFLDRAIADSISSWRQGYERRFPGMSQKKKDWISLYVASGSASILTAWAKGGMKEDIDAAASFIAQMNDRVLK